MKKLFSEIKIDASPKQVWAVFTDFDAYPQWNPFIRRIQGNLDEDEQLEVVMQPPNSKTVICTPTVLKVILQREVRWSEKRGIAGLYESEHSFKNQTRGNSGVWFMHKKSSFKEYLFHCCLSD